LQRGNNCLTGEVIYHLFSTAQWKATVRDSKWVCEELVWKSSYEKNFHLTDYSPFLKDRNQAKSTTVKKFHVTVHKQFN